MVLVRSRACLSMQVLQHDCSVLPAHSSERLLTHLRAARFRTTSSFMYHQQNAVCRQPGNHRHHLPPAALT